MSSQLLSRQVCSGDAWARLLRSHAAMRRSLSADLQAEHGLTVNDYEALLLLSRAEDGRLRRVDLADGLQLTPSGVTRLLDGLHELGCVEKATCASDARVTYAVLTEAGPREARAGGLLAHRRDPRADGGALLGGGARDLRRAARGGCPAPAAPESCAP